MIASDAATVGALRADRIVAFYYSTNGEERSLLTALRGRFSGSTSG
jgi:hypothetical protein